MRQSQITINIELDDNHIPDSIQWTAPDGGVENMDSKAALLSFWDYEKKEALRIDLWTKDMPVDDMKRFVHQVFVSLAHSYQRATSEDDVASKIEEFAETYALAAGIKM